VTDMNGRIADGTLFGPYSGSKFMQMLEIE
jgi:hypothetical protein